MPLKSTTYECENENWNVAIWRPIEETCIVTTHSSVYCMDSCILISFVWLLIGRYSLAQLIGILFFVNVEWVYNITQLHSRENIPKNFAIGYQVLTLTFCRTKKCFDRSQNMNPPTQINSAEFKRNVQFLEATSLMFT